MSKPSMSARDEWAAKAQYEAVTGKPWEEAPHRSARLCRQDSAAIAAAIDSYDAEHDIVRVDLNSYGPIIRALIEALVVEP